MGQSAVVEASRRAAGEGLRDAWTWALRGEGRCEIKESQIFWRPFG